MAKINELLEEVVREINNMEEEQRLAALTSAMLFLCVYTKIKASELLVAINIVKHMCEQEFIQSFYEYVTSKIIKREYNIM